MRIHGIPWLTAAFLILATGSFGGCGGGLTATQSSDYDSLIEDGWTEYNGGNYDEAQRIFCKAKSIEPTLAEGYIGCGWTLLRRQHPDSSAVAFKLAMPHITTLEDSVDAVCGLAGAYLANGNNNKAATILNNYPISDVSKGFPFRKHDFLIEAGHLEMVQAMAFYRLGYYTASESADPDNAVYHLNRVLAKPYAYTTPQGLMEKITEYLDRTNGGTSL